MLVALFAFGILDLAVLTALAVALHRAPEGYQAPDGFHFGPGCDLDDCYEWPANFTDADLTYDASREGMHVTLTHGSAEPVAQAAP